MKLNEAIKLSEMLTQLNPHFAKRHISRFWLLSKEDSENRKNFKYKKRKIDKEKKVKEKKPE